MKPTLRIAAIILALSNLTSFGHAQTIEKTSLTTDGAQKVIAAAVASRQSTRTISRGATKMGKLCISALAQVCIAYVSTSLVYDPDNELSLWRSPAAEKKLSDAQRGLSLRAAAAFRK